MKKLLLLLITSIWLFGCYSDGEMAYIYHDVKKLVETGCDYRVDIAVTPDTVRVELGHPAFDGYVVVERYTYMNDGKYNIVKNNCYYKGK